MNSQKKYLIRPKKNRKEDKILNAVIYLTIVFLFGMEIANMLMKSGNYQIRHKGENMLWIYLPVSFVCGILPATWASYLSAWFFHRGMKVKEPLMYADLTVFSIISVIIVFKRKKADRTKALPD